MKNDQEEKIVVPPERRSMPCNRCHSHSVPPSIHRRHSLPSSFAYNKWGSEETRKSYTCLCSLDKNTDCKRCISSSTLNALDRYSLRKMSNPKWRGWWGNFLDLSSSIDADATDDD